MTTSRKKTTSTTRSSKSVYFYPDQDEVLLKAIAQAVDSGQVANFSELCKQALQRMLLADLGSFEDGLSGVLEGELDRHHISEPALWTQLQAQVDTLQAQVQHLQKDSDNKKWLKRLEQDLKGLSQRVDQLAAPPQPEPDPNPPARTLPEDPLLRRLAPLLEEF
ncbi:MAG: hypothetical protein ACFCU9_03240 [Cyanophyceae cyanobacterium]